MASARYRIGRATLRRWGGCLIWVGTLLFGLISMLHPPTFDPFATSDAMSEIIASKYWSLIHWGLAIGMTLLGLGLLTLHAWLERLQPSAFSWFATGATVISTTLWLAIFVFEAAGGAALAQAFFHPTTTPAVASLITATWAATLAIGYAAAALLGFAVFLWSLDLLRTRRFPAGFVWLGIISGAALMVAQPLTWLNPNAALFILAAPAAAFGLWLVSLGWQLWASARLANDS